MPDEPTANGDDETPGRPLDEVAPDGGQGGSIPPGGDAYRWHGPAGQPYPGQGAPPPFAAPYGQYGTPHNPYGPPPNPYSPPQSQPYAWPYVPPQPPRPPRSDAERRRRRLLGLAFAGALVLAVGAGIGIGAAIAPTSPASTATALVTRAINATTKAGTYHYIERSTLLGAKDDIAGDATPDGGRQKILQRCSGGTTFFHLRLVDGVVYFRGTRLAVVDQLGVPASRAASVAGKWVKVVKGEKPYATFAGGITTSSNSSELRSVFIPTSTRTAPGASGSTEVLGALSKTTKSNDLLGSAALVVASQTGLPRTLRATETRTTGSYTLAWTFSRYREKVTVPAPSGAVSYSSLHATPPSKTICA